MMQHFDGSIATERRSEAASCIVHIKRDTTADDPAVPSAAGGSGDQVAAEAY